MSSSLFASIGSSNLWGLSSSFDCAAYCSPSSCDTNALSILLINPGDIRHILETVFSSGKFKNNELAIHFYIIEADAETICREILLLETALDTSIPIRQRANMFLEIYGNCKVQDKTSRYIAATGKNLSKLVTNNVGNLKDIVDLTCLKYRQRDEMELVFKSYSLLNDKFDIEKLREFRLRGYYADRFDNRKEVSDWDYHYSIKGTSAEIIHIKQFKEWRMSGIAFEFGDQYYTDPNRTMMAYAEGYMKTGKDQGLKKEVKGFWGDIVCSPFYSFGIDTDVENSEFAKGLFEIVNKDTGTEQHRHNTVEIAVHNLFCYLWKMEKLQSYVMTKQNDIFSGFGSKQANIISHEEQGKDDDDNDLGIILDDDNSNNDDDNKSSKIQPLSTLGAEICDQNTTPDTIFSCIESSATVSASTSTAANSTTIGNENENSAAAEFEAAKANTQSCWHGIKVFPIIGSFSDEMSKSKYENKFDMSFISCRSAHVIDSPIFKKSMKSGSKIVVETAKHLVHLTKAQKAEFITKVDDFAMKQNFQKISLITLLRRRDEKDTLNSLIAYQNN